MEFCLSPESELRLVCCGDRLERRWELVRRWRGRRAGGNEGISKSVCGANTALPRFDKIRYGGEISNKSLLLPLGIYPIRSSSII